MLGLIGCLVLSVTASRIILRRFLGGLKLTWLWWSKQFWDPILVGIGEFTTHFRTSMKSGWIESDIHWGVIGLLSHGQLRWSWVGAHLDFSLTQPRLSSKLTKPRVVQQPASPRPAPLKLSLLIGLQLLPPGYASSNSIL